MKTINYLMPSLGSDMDHGIIAKWLIKNGDYLKKGDPVAEIETDKGNIEISAWNDSIVESILHQEGEEINVGVPLLKLNIEEDFHLKSKNENEIIGVTKNLEINDNSLNNYLKDNFIQNTLSIKKDHPRKSAMAKLVEKSKKNIPHFYIEKSFDQNILLNWLEHKNQSASVEDNILPIACYVKAIAMALNNYPIFNSKYNNEIIYNEDINISIITSLHDGGLVAPVIKNPQNLELKKLMIRTYELIIHSREGKLKQADVSDATISLTNLGENGADKVFGVIYPPQCCIIGIGSIQKNNLCTWTMSVDHRVTNGHVASKFLNQIESYLKLPQQLE